MIEGLADFGTCEVCGQTITGSHYHCSCGTTDVTGMYGHHTGSCRITKATRDFHHCGPNNDCELEEAGE